MRESFAAILKGAGTGVLLVIFLFANRFWEASSIFISSIFKKSVVIFQDSEIQEMTFLCLVIYLIAIFFLRSKADPNYWRIASPIVWVGVLFLTGAILCSIQHPPSTQSLILLGAAVFGQGIAVCVRSGKRIHCREIAIIIVVLLGILTFAAAFRNQTASPYEYHEHLRWSGLWENPNLAGLLMGTGIVLAIGLLAQNLKFKVRVHEPDALGLGYKIGERNSELIIWPSIVAILSSFAAIFMAVGLVNTCCRGAWVATVSGFGYLVWRAVQNPRSNVRSNLTAGFETQNSEVFYPTMVSRFFNWTRRNRLSVFAIILSVSMLGIFQSSSTRDILVDRALSVRNVNDFSWRNRIAAWNGALQITAEHPWLGVGWNQPELLYEYYYLPPALTEAAAIEMNDYLMLSATLGLPVFVCFGIFIWLALKERSLVLRISPKHFAAENKKSEIAKFAWLQSTCRAGAIVLLVGFWFDGGLFRLATAPVFWILLELGRQDLVQQKAPEETKIHPLIT